MARSMSREELEEMFVRSAEDVSQLMETLHEHAPEALGPGVSAIGAAILVIEQRGKVAT